jgi:CHAT domain-containing protein/tetratricopeptide (TPR) repeat protein
MRSSLLTAGLFMLALKPGAGNGQCLPDDTIRQRIAEIRADQNTYLIKIDLLSKLGVSYLRCHPKPGPAYAEIEHRLGDFYNQIGDIKKAIDYTDTAVEINSHTGKPEPFLCHSLYNLGTFYKKMYLLNISRDYYKRAIEIGRRFLKTEYHVTALAHIALSVDYFQIGDFQQSSNTASVGLLLTPVTDTLDVAELLAQKVQSEIELGSYQDARQDIKRSLFLLRGYSVKDPLQKSGLSSAYSVYARLLNATGKHLAATDYYKKAFELNMENRDLAQCARDLMDIGLVFDDNLGQEDKARACYQKGLQLNTGDSYVITGLYINMGLSYWREGNFKTALACYQKGLNTLPINFKDTGYERNPGPEMLRLIFNDFFASILLGNKGECLLNLYQKEHSLPVLKAALQTFLIADQAVDMMRWNQYAEQSKLFWRTQTKLMYENAIEVCYLLDDASHAYYFFEKSRAVLLNDQLTHSTQWNLLSPKDRNEEKELLISLNTLNLQLQSANSAPGNNNAVYHEWLSEHKKWEHQQKLLDKKYAGRFYFGGNSVDSLSNIQQLLHRNGQSLIEYFNGSLSVYALLVTATKTKIFKISYPGYLRDAGNFLRYCSDAGLLNQHHEQYSALASQLYKRLFQALQIQTKRVIISPGDIFIPFDALLDDPKSDSSFLMKKYAFSYVYSMRVLMQRDTGMATPASAFLGIAPENYAPRLHLQSLKSSWASLQHIERGFNSSLILHGKDANKKSLLSSLPQFQIVQIYSHADADSSSMDPLLYMADSAVRLTDIQQLKLSNTELIVLSACNTGVGRTAIGEGVFSLSRGFRMAGIPSTVTNLWQADNQATYQLTESFYNYLKMGMPKDLALQKAKLGFLRDDKTDHLLPYYWAATIVLGDTAPLHAQVNSNHLLRVLLLVCSLLIVLAIPLSIFLFRKKGSER